MSFIFYSLLYQGILPLNLYDMLHIMVKEKNPSLLYHFYSWFLLSLSLLFFTLFFTLFFINFHGIRALSSWLPQLLQQAYSISLCLLILWFFISQISLQISFIQWIINLSSWVFLSIFFKFLACAHSVLSLILFLESLSCF